MTKSEFMALCEARWSSLEEVSRDNLYDLEKEFSEIWQDLGKDVLEKQIGEVPVNHRKKKSGQHVRKSGDKQC